MRDFLPLLVLLMFVSCGPKKEESLIRPAEPEKYKYSFYEKDCKTGEHEYYYLDDACEALLDEEINNYCAPEKRKKLYNMSCRY